MSMVGYLLLINSALKEHILSLREQEKKRLREKFEFLAHGIWDAGVRVKKLRGITSKVIFEARSSKGERILFTLGRHGDFTAIYVWGIVKHDDIGSEAQAILPSNTPFLQFEPFAQEELPEVIIDELPNDYFSQEAIEEKTPEDYGPQKWHVLSDEEWKRLLLAGEKDNFDLHLFLTEEQKKVLELEPPVLLSGTAGSGKTTIAVYYLLRKEFINKRRIFLTYSHYLKRFSERIYDGLVRHTELEKSASRPDFYVFRDLIHMILKNSNREFDESREVRLREFKDLFSSHSLSKKYDAELVWEEIRSIIKGAKPSLSVQRYRKLAASWLAGEISRSAIAELRDYLLGLKNFKFTERIERFIEKKTVYSSYDEFASDIYSGLTGARGDAPFVIEEVLKAVEKKAHSFSSPLLSFEEYRMLGKKRAPNFLYDRRDIYSIAEYYQGRLEEQGLWDEIDLTRRAIKLLGTSGDTFLYDLVVCDEVQDFADIQLSLIFRLTGSCRRVLLAGDTKQIINPSGFRWEEVKDKFYERGIQVPEVLTLNLNFRCVGNIVKLSNALLDLKARFVGLSGSELREEWKFNGKPPCLVYGLPENEITRRIRITGAGQIILVRTVAESTRLKELLHTELVFTIQEAKGLEFDAVLLWHFSRDPKAEKFWRKIKDEHYFDRSHLPHIRHEINLLYVAVTRARNNLIIYDGEESSDVWEVDTLRDLLYRTDRREDLLTVWQRVSSPSEWEQQGNYFFERHYYPAAVECFRNAGNMELAEHAEAFVLEEKKEYGKSAALFELHGYYERAAVNYERAATHEKALAMWEKLGNGERAHLCRIKLYEHEGDYNRAASEWERRGDYEQALKNWERAENHARIAEYFLVKKRYEEAAQRFEQAGLIEDACALYKKLRMYEKAASGYFKAGDYRKAAALYKKLNDTDNLIRCYERLGDYHAIALIHEKSKDIEKAIEYFKKFSESSDEQRQQVEEEAKLLLKGRKLLKSALRFSALGRFESSAPVFLKKGYLDLAVREFEKIGDPARLFECYSRMGEHYRAAVELEKASQDDIDGRVEEALFKYIYPDRSYDKKRADKLFYEAENYLNRGDNEKALRRYRTIRFPEGILDAYLRLDRDEEAIKYFLENAMFDEAQNFVKEKPVLVISPDLIRYIYEEVFGRRTWYYDGKHEKLDFAIKLFESCLKCHQDKETRALINGIVNDITMSYYFDTKDRFPQSFLNLAMELKNYNALFSVLSWRYDYTRRKKLPKIAARFLEALREKADRTGDKNLLACYFYFYDREKFEDILEGELIAGPDNYELFDKSSRSFRKAVDYLAQVGNTERAARYARSHDEYNLAGRVYEMAGDYKLAGRQYRDGKNYEEALKCFAHIQAELEIARVYERMKAYGKALEIFKKLGKPREVQRLEKKVKKAQQEKDQLNLFKNI